MKLFIFYGSYLAFPFLIFLLSALFFKPKALSWFTDRSVKSIALYAFLALTLLFIYARFIEPQMITVQTTPIRTGFKAKLITISDIHLGLFKDEDYLKRVVAKINTIKNVDAVLIPGDFTYYPYQDLDVLFKPLKDIKVPVYAILGNHDSERPGPPLRDQLKKTLQKYGIHFLHNTAEKLPIRGASHSITVLGLGDKWAREDDINLIDRYTKKDNLIVFTHNPDTTMSYRNNIPDLTIAGHTHGGQIRIPFIYKNAIPCKGDFDQGLYQQKFGPVFVTSGIGEVGLPLRLGIPPVIDILELH